ncbi:MAG: MFS transporter [Pontibacterium sp.]
MTQPAVPYVRLSGFYFFYFSLLGVIVPFWSLYLADKGFTPEVLGALVAMVHLSRIVAPNIWGWLADKTGERVKIIRWGSFLTCVLFSLIFWQEGALGIALVTLAFSFFWNAVLPQFELVTLNNLGKAQANYSRIRLWGSIGFVVAVLGVGALLDVMPIRYLPFVMLGLMLLIWLNALWVSEPKQGDEGATTESQPIWQTLKRPEVVVFFLVCFLNQFAHGGYYTFYSVLMEDTGYSRTQIGLLWSLGVVAEILLFIVMPHIIKRASYTLIMAASLALAAVRWWVIGFMPDHFVLLLLGQLAHAATFGAMHVAGIALVQVYFKPKQQGQGQALFSSLGFGLGGALGAFAAGYLWLWGGESLTFGVSALASLLALVLLFVVTQRSKMPVKNEESG